MTKELLHKLEAICITKTYQEEILPALVQMREECREANDKHNDELITAFLRGRISILTELIRLEDNIKQRAADEARIIKESSTNARRPRDLELRYVDKSD